MVTIDDIATAVTTVLQGDSTFTSSVPGKAWFERPPDTPPSYPYAVFKVTAGRADLCFDDVYTQPFTLEIAAYVRQGQDATPSDPNSVQQALFGALADEAAEQALMTTPLRNTTERILHAKLQLPSGKYDQRLRDGRDIFVCGLTVQILVQGDRSVP